MLPSPPSTNPFSSSAAGPGPRMSPHTPWAFFGAEHGCQQLSAPCGRFTRGTRGVGAGGAGETFQLLLESAALGHDLLNLRANNAECPAAPCYYAAKGQ